MRRSYPGIAPSRGVHQPHKAPFRLSFGAVLQSAAAMDSHASAYREMGSLTIQKESMGRPRLSPSTRNALIEEQKQDLLRLLGDRIGLILNNAQVILTNEQYFYCLLPSAYLSVMFLPESGPIPLGVLIRLWERRVWMDRCPHCNEWVYIIGAAGNPLSQSHSWWGLCPDCKGDVNQQGPSLIHGTTQDFLQDICDPARELLKVYDNRPITLKRNVKHCSADSPEASSVPIRPVEPASFTELLHVFKIRKNGLCR